MADGLGGELGRLQGLFRHVRDGVCQGKSLSHSSSGDSGLGVEKGRSSAGQSGNEPHDSVCYASCINLGFLTSSEAAPAYFYRCVRTKCLVFHISSLTQAACLRAVRLGNLGNDATEAHMRLAAIAERYGRASAAVQLYFRIMARPATNDDER